MLVNDDSGWLLEFDDDSGEDVGDEAPEDEYCPDDFICPITE